MVYTTHKNGDLGDGEKNALSTLLIIVGKWTINNH
jgi:hypothetical protein